MDINDILDAINSMTENDPVKYDKFLDSIEQCGIDIDRGENDFSHSANNLDYTFLAISLMYGYASDDYYAKYELNRCPCPETGPTQIEDLIENAFGG